jgi:hypothetical protein
LFDVLDAGEHDSREDVADVPPFGQLRIAVPFEVGGEWMFHTHLLDAASRPEGARANRLAAGLAVRCEYELREWRRRESLGGSRRP